MAIYSESTLPGKIFLQFFKVMTGEVDNHTAAGTYQMVMVLRETSNVTPTAASSMYLADKPHFSKNI
jgi:hypothetical protein